ncbi:MAG TPA: formylglycine-generating enzyme family protein [Bryobacteraceae bacterium]|nr:formylglycine-generating enzyme family protein [Bryobacteraceae bacterium]
MGSRGFLIRSAGVCAAVLSIAAIGQCPAQSSAVPELPRWEFVTIAPGEFQMGCSPDDRECGEDEKPAHRVRITKGFELGKYEVTQAQWEAMMGSNPSEVKGADLPVEQVSWNDIQDFLRRVNGRDDHYRYRLPHEAEWEYAARAGTSGPYYGELDAIAWYGRNSANQAHPVGGKQPNAWGLYDMIGNAWEWCQDWYESDAYRAFAKDPAVDPHGPASGEYRVLRGGSWYQYLWFLRVSSRFRERPGGRFRHTGFRCLRERS